VSKDLLHFPPHWIAEGIELLRSVDLDVRHPFFRVRDVEPLKALESKGCHVC
jgi:hypothetical protein